MIVVNIRTPSRHCVSNGTCDVIMMSLFSLSLGKCLLSTERRNYMCNVQCNTCHHFIRTNCTCSVHIHIPSQWNDRFQLGMAESMIILYLLIWNSPSLSTIDSCDQPLFYVTQSTCLSFVAAILAACYDDITCPTGNMVSRCNHHVHNDHLSVSDNYYRSTRRTA